MSDVVTMTLARRIAAAIDTFSEWTGQAVSWLVGALVLLIVYDVAMRYLFQAGSVGLQELEWHLFAVIFLLGAAYTAKHDAHVRVDILYDSTRMTPKHRALVNITGTVFFLWPFCVLIIYSSWPFVANSFAISEGSPDAGGLPYRFLLKAAIPLGFALLALQGVANLIHALGVLFTSVENETKK